MKNLSIKDGLSAYIMGRNYYSSENGYPQNYNLSYEYYKLGVEKFYDARCIYGFAMFYFDDGESESENVVKKDNDYANKLFMEAYPYLVQLAQSGDMYATFILGAYYNYGLGKIKKDFKLALKYIKKAAKMGHSGACFDMGKFYEIGKGVKQNLNTSNYYYRLSASLGNTRAKQKIDQK